MFYKITCLIFLFILVEAEKKIDVKELKCLVCEKTMQEIDEAASKIDPDKKVEIGGYRIDAEGNLQQKTISQAKSELVFSELLDNICEKMDDYVRATKKTNGDLILLKLIAPDGGMNPESSNVDFIQDDDLNKSLKYYCENLLEEHEENIIKHYLNNSDNIDIRICSEEAKLCSKTLPDPNEDYIHEDL